MKRFTFLAVFAVITLATLPLAFPQAELSSKGGYSPDNHYTIGTETDRRPYGVYAGTEMAIAGSKLVHFQKSLTAANLLAMYATPVQVIASQGAGKSIVVAKAIFKVTWTATDFASGGVLILQYDSTANGAGTNAVDSTLAATFLTHGAAGAAGSAYSVRNGAVLSTVTNTGLENKGLYISNATGAFTTGTGVVVVDVWYYVQS